MNTNDLNKLPRYIEAPGGGMWGPMPDGFSISNEDAVFVKLKDVQALVRPLELKEVGGATYDFVGTGSTELAEKAKTKGWTLYAHDYLGMWRDYWDGDHPEKKYYRRVS